MPIQECLNGKSGPAAAIQAAALPHLRRKSCCAGLVLASALGASAQNPGTPGGALRTDLAGMPTAINQPPGPNAQMQMHQQQARQLNLARANSERKKQIVEASAKLLELAAGLKVEVEKDGQDPSSLNLIHRVEEIEALAHSVKEKMKLTVAAKF